MKSLKGSLQERIAFLKLKSGDSDAFVFFYDKYSINIYRYVLIKVSDKQLAEDITQDIFLKVWQHLVDKRHITSFSAFIFRIARNSVIDHYRRSNKQELPLEYVPESVGMVEDSSDIIDKSISADILLKQVKSLKPEYQEIIVLRYIEDLSISEIAEVIEKDKNTVRVTLHRAVHKLKKITDNK